MTIEGQLPKLGAIGTADDAATHADLMTIITDAGLLDDAKGFVRNRIASLAPGAVIVEWRWEIDSTLGQTSGVDQEP